MEADKEDLEAEDLEQQVKEMYLLSHHLKEMQEDNNHKVTEQVADMAVPDQEVRVVLPDKLQLVVHL
jgi:hypothetical protein